MIQSKFKSTEQGEAEDEAKMIGYMLVGGASVLSAFVAEPANLL